jgi:hypothetical protein
LVVVVKLRYRAAIAAAMFRHNDGRIYGVVVLYLTLALWEG